MVSPGAAGPPDMGFIVQIPQTSLAVGGMPLAVSGSMCQMVNSLSGAPYPLVIGALASTGIRVNGMALVRQGDMIPSPPGILTVLGPPAEAAGREDRGLGQVAPLDRPAADERVTRILALAHRHQRDPVRQAGGQILEGVHREIDPALEHRIVDLAREERAAPDL